MKLLKICLLLFAFSLLASCTPEAIGDMSSHSLDGAQSTNDNDIVIDRGSKP